MRNGKVCVDAVVVGTGPQGTRMALSLQRCGLRFLTVDPNPIPGAQLAERFKDCSTRQLRSKVREHCDCTPESLVSFSAGDPDGVTADGHPTVGLFLRHLRHVWDRHNLGETHVAGWVASMQRDPSGRLELATTEGLIQTNEVFLCLGEPAPNYPGWAATTRGHNPRVSHIYDDDYELDGLPPGERVLVVGGGITAVQVAVSIALQKGRHVKLLVRRPLGGGTGETSTVDWLDPARRETLCGLPWDRRAEYLRKEGDRGTVPAWEMERLAECEANGTITVQQAEIALLAPSRGRPTVQLVTTDGSPITGNLVVLATGLDSRLPEWLVASANALGLPVDGRGGPHLTNSLEWGAGSGVYLTGPHACNVVGPFAANIVGGMIAAEITEQRLRCQPARATA